MSLYVESHQALGRHPKTTRAARSLGISAPQMVGHLMFLWWHCLDFAQDGDITNLDAEEMADAARWEGEPNDFFDALLTCGKDNPGFIERDGDRLLVHDWDEYAGKYFRKLQSERERAKKNYQEEKKGRGEGDAISTSSLQVDYAKPTPRLHPLTERREEENRGEKKNIPGAQARVREEPAGFADWWGIYPRKIDKAKAQTSYAKKLAEGHAPEDIRQGGIAWLTYWKREKTEEKHIPHPQTWLNNDRFLASPPRPSPAHLNGKPGVVDSIRAVNAAFLGGEVDDEEWLGGRDDPAVIDVAGAGQGRQGETSPVQPLLRGA